jgi:hypothetical protein
MSNPNLSEIKATLEDAVVPSGYLKGKVTKRIKQFTTSDGKTVYVCNKVPDCDYNHTHWMSVVGHTSKHTERLAVVTPNKKQKAEAELTGIANSLRKLADSVEQHKDLGDEAASSWKERALRAERELKRIKRVFGSLAD